MQQTIDLVKLRADFDLAKLDRVPPRKVLRALEVVATWVQKQNPQSPKK